MQLNLDFLLNLQELFNMKPLINLLIIVSITVMSLGNAKDIVSLEDLTLIPASGSNIIFNDGSLTPSRPMKIGASNELTSGLIVLSDANDISGTLGVANGGTGSTTQNYVDLITAQSVAGLKTFTDSITVSSTTSGAIPCPVMTGVERDLIGSPVKGNCLFNSTTNVLNTYSGSAWEGVGSGGGGLDKWLTATGYTTDDVIFTDDKIYVALTDHTSGVFATDLANLDWSELSPVLTDAEVKTAYENNADTNALTDAEKTLLGNTSGLNTGDQIDISGTAGSAGALVSASTIIDISAAAAPETGDVLTATSDTEATWQTPSTITDISGTSGSTLGLSSLTTIVDVSSAAAPTSGQVLTATGDSAATWQTPSSGGDVSGGSSSLDNEIVRFDLTTGKLIQAYTSDGPTISDTGVPSFAVAAYATSERVGASSSVGALTSVAFGNSANASGGGSSAIGYNANATGTGGHAFGANTNALATSTLAIGGGAFVNGGNSISIGTNATIITHQNSIAIGVNARADRANSFTVGAAGAAINDVYFGEGEKTTVGTHADMTIHVTRPQNKTDKQGGNFILAGAGSTGTAFGASVKIQTQTAVSATGTTENTTWEDMFEVTGNGEIIFNAESTATVDGSLWNNSLSMYMDETDDNLVFKLKDSGATIRTINIPYYTQREILNNSSFEDTTAANGWTCTGGTAATETTERVLTEGAQSLKYTVTASTFSCYQTYDCSKSPSIPQGFLAYVQSTDDIEVCGFDGTNDINCVTPTSDDTFQLALAEITGGGTCGIKIKSDTSITDVIYMDGVKFTEQPYRFVDINGATESYVAYTGNGHGSTDTRIRRYATVSLNTTGDVVTVTDTAANGLIFTVNKDDTEIKINISERASTGTSKAGISLNSTELTTNIDAIIAADRLAITMGNSADDEYYSTSATLIADAGDEIRVHTNGDVSASSTGPSVSFTATATTSEHVVVPATLQASQVTGSGNAGTALGAAFVTDIDFTEVSDINGDWNGTTFTAPRDGNYLVNGNVQVTANNQFDLYLYKDTVGVRLIAQAAAALSIQNFNFQTTLLKGEAISIRTSTASLTLSNVNEHHIAIQEIPSEAKLLAAIPNLIFAADVDSAEAVTNNDNLYLSSCTDADPSICTFATDFFNEIPRCWTADGGTTGVTATTLTTATIDRVDATTAFTLFCKGKRPN